MNNATENSNAMADMEAQLRQAAQAADEGKVVDTSAIETGAATDDKGDQTTAAGMTPDASKLAPDKSEKTDGQPPKQKDGEVKPTDEKSSEFAKKAAERQKERERQDRTWEKLQQRRQEIEQREAELERREQELQQGRSAARPEQVAGPARDESGYSAEDWEKAAQAWGKEGKLDLSEIAREKAEALKRQPSRDDLIRGNPDKAEKPQEIPNTPEFLNVWKGHLTELAAENPDLKNPESALYKATAAVLNSDPRFKQFNDGIKHAFRIAQLEIKAEQADSLDAKVKELTQQLEKLQKATTPGASGAETMGKAKSFAEMSPAEQERHLLELASAAE